MFLFSLLNHFDTNPYREVLNQYFYYMLQEMDDEEGYFSVSMENTERDEVKSLFSISLLIFGNMV